MTEPRPYVPPDVAASRDRKKGAKPSKKEQPTYPKPWMYPRAGETESERVGRLHHTCVHCGLFERNMKALDKHEDACDGREADAD